MIIPEVSVAEGQIFVDEIYSGIQSFKSLNHFKRTAPITNLEIDTNNNSFEMDVEQDQNMELEIRSSKALNIPSTSTIETMVNKESVEESSAEENAEISMQDTVLQIISQKSTARVVAQRLRVKHVSLKLCCGPHSCVWYNSRCND